MRNHKGLLSLLFTATCLVFLSSSCKRTAEAEDFGTTKISIYMEKTIGGQARRIKVYSTESDGPFVIELEGANMSLTMKEPPKSLEEDIKEDMDKNKND